MDGIEQVLLLKDSKKISLTKTSMRKFTVLLEPTKTSAQFQPSLEEKLLTLTMDGITPHQASHPLLNPELKKLEGPKLNQESLTMLKT